MALGLVQPRPGDIPRQADVASSPRHARRHRTVSLSKINDSMLTQLSKVKILLDIVLNTPVLVVPRSSSSPHVLVAHLGKITISNCRTNSSCELLDTSVINKDDMLSYNFTTEDFRSNDNIFEMDDVTVRADDEGDGSFIDEAVFSDDGIDIYSIDIRNMNLYSLDTTSRKGFRLSALPRAEEFYSCHEDAIAIVHDTAIRLEICRKLETSAHGSNFDSHATSFNSIADTNEGEQVDQLLISGCIVNPLRLSLKRQQYEQLLETIDNIFKVPANLVRPAESNPNAFRFPTIDENQEQDIVDNFVFDNNQKIRKALLYQTSVDRSASNMQPKVIFNLPVFIIQLNNNDSNPLIEISFRDFNVNYEKQHLYETNLQVSLRSVVMEDLLRPIDSKHRIMVSSSNNEDQQLRLKNPCLSHSCPNLVGYLNTSNLLSTSLPSNLEPNIGFYQYATQRKFQRQENSGNFLNAGGQCPGTPPPSPLPRSREDNLVIYSSLIVDPSCPFFESKFKSLHQRSSIDFNCLNLNVSVESWFVLLNFFGLMSDDNETENNSSSSKSSSTESDEPEQNSGKTQLDITVKSLNLVLVRPDYELAKANVSNARFIVSKVEASKTVEGSLGSISLSDLTVHGGIYREKFQTSGNEALNFTYVREQARPVRRSLNKDCNLKIKMSSVRYVHTKRFVMEIQTFFKEFLQLQMPVIRKIKPSDYRRFEQRPTQVGLEIYAESPLFLLPLSSRSDKIIVANLGEFSLKNEFRMSNDPQIISVRKEKYGPIELLDVMMVNLLHTDLFAAYRSPKTESNCLESYNNSMCIDMGSYFLFKNGPSVLKDKCHLKLQIERNLDTWKSHNVPDISVHGTLSRLEAVLDLQQYKLVRGFLSYNLGETIDDVYAASTLKFCESNISLNTSSVSQSFAAK